MGCIKRTNIDPLPASQVDAQPYRFPTPRVRSQKGRQLYGRWTARTATPQPLGSQIGSLHLAHHTECQDPK
jgi:hypothetical protein